MVINHSNKTAAPKVGRCRTCFCLVVPKKMTGLAVVLFINILCFKLFAQSRRPGEHQEESGCDQESDAP